MSIIILYIRHSSAYLIQIFQHYILLNEKKYEIDKRLVRKVKFLPFSLTYVASKINYVPSKNSAPLKKRHYTKFNLANCSSITPNNYIFFTKGVIQEVNEVSAIICYWDQVIHKYVFLDEQYYKLVSLMTHTPTFETKKRSSFL